jgi:hypothetical protein
VLLCNETKCASDRGFTNSIQTTRTFSLETSGGYRRCLPKGSEFRPVVRGGGKLANGSQPTHASGHTAQRVVRHVSLNSRESLPIFRRDTRRMPLFTLFPIKSAGRKRTTQPAHAGFGDSSLNGR